MRSRRGSVLVESALTLMVILFLFYGALQLGVVGLEQLTVDGGAFTMAHQQSFESIQGGPKKNADAFSLAKTALPHLAAPNVSSTSYPGQPPAALSNTENANYQNYYNIGNANSGNARFGGVSMVQPVQTVATVTKSKIDNLLLGVAGQPQLTVSGTAIEPSYQLINGHADVAGNGFDSANAFSTAADPLSESAPPYLVGFNYMQMCPYQLPINAAGKWSTCPDSSLVTALGSAEYLDAHNWTRHVNGVSPSFTAVFWEMRYHQMLYAQISTTIASHPGRAAVAPYLNYGLGADARANDVACIYNFDNVNVGAYAAGNIGIGDPLFQLHPDYTSPTCVAP